MVVELIVPGVILWAVCAGAAPVNIDYEKETNSHWGASMTVGGFVTSNEKGVSGQYLTKGLDYIIVDNTTECLKTFVR